MSKIVLKKIARADNLFTKSLGVIGWKDFGEKNGLLLTGTNSIHTYFVRFPLDLVFLDKNMKVIKLVKNLKPFRISPIVWSAKHVLEMPTNSIKKFSINVGDEINLL